MLRIPRKYQPLSVFSCPPAKIYYLHVMVTKMMTMTTKMMMTMMMTTMKMIRVEEDNGQSGGWGETVHCDSQSVNWWWNCAQVTLAFPLVAAIPNVDWDYPDICCTNKQIKKQTKDYKSNQAKIINDMSSSLSLSLQFQMLIGADKQTNKANTNNQTNNKQQI